jgi:predicted SAM-dependent methyltransferase
MPSLKLHIGGEQPHPEWRILNISPGPHVDFVGSCTDLSQFADESIDEIYGSHVYEHLDFREFLQAFKEAYRVLKPQGKFWVAVPDMDQLCQLYLNRSLSLRDRVELTRVIFGGQMNRYDYHKIGLNQQMLLAAFEEAGFHGAERRPAFGVFKDLSDYTIGDIRVSLNVVAFK